MKPSEILKSLGISRTAYNSNRQRHISYWILTEMLKSGLLPVEDNERVLHLLEIISVCNKSVLGGLDLLFEDNMFFLDNLAFYKKIIRKLMMNAPKKYAESMQ